jgi:hypothetical protein
MRRLREVREWRERFGMGVSGGLVRVAGSGEDEAQGAAAPEDDTREGPARDSPAPLVGTTSESDAGVVEGPRVADPSSAAIEINFDWD